MKRFNGFNRLQAVGSRFSKSIRSYEFISSVKVSPEKHEEKLSYPENIPECKYGEYVVNLKRGHLIIFLREFRDGSFQLCPTVTSEYSNKFRKHIKEDNSGFVKEGKVLRTFRNLESLDQGFRMLEEFLSKFSQKINSVRVK